MYSKELNLAIKAVKHSESTFRKYFGKKVAVKTKHHDYRDLVSYADKKIEQEIKTFLLKHSPASGFIGEEYGTQKSSASSVWIIDPIDGTTNYLHGLSDSCISLAFMQDGNVVAGAVLAPMQNRIFTASKNHGAYLNHKKIQVSNISNLKYSFGCFGWGRDIKFASTMFPILLNKIQKLRVAGSGALAICDVASGIYDFFYGRSMFLWDYAAAKLILEEAGGKFIEIKKPPIQIAANKKDLILKIKKLIKN